MDVHTTSELFDDTTVPGTVHLVDIEGILQKKHAKGSNADVVLVPTPSPDPDDPLNWSPRRKILSTTCMLIYVTMISIGVSMVYSILIPISTDTGLSLNTLNSGTGYQYLAFGWGCLIWQPMALQYGKRPIYLLSLLLSMGVAIAIPYITTSGPWMACKVLQGLFGAPVESLGEISVADIYFSHERGTYMALYSAALFGGGFLAPFFAGFINDGQGWAWVQYWCAIFLGLGFVFCLFFMEETNYDRSPIQAIHAVGPETPMENDITPNGLDPEKTVPVSNISTNTGSTDPVVYTPKTYLQKLKLFDKKRPFNLIRMMTRPLIFLSFPVIAYAGFTYGCNLIWFNTLNATASLILGGAPYNFAPSMVGLSYLSPCVGVTVATFYTGKLGDWVVLRLTRRNGGIWESEQRLWLFLISILLVPGSLLLWGLGAYHGVHWFGLIVAMAMLACAVTIGCQLSLSYCVDTYKDLSGEAVITVIIIRNTMACAFGFGVTPWVVNMGYQNCFLVAAFVGLAQVLTFLLMVKWGPKLRQNSKQRYYKYVMENATLGLAH